MSFYTSNPYSVQFIVKHYVDGSIKLTCGNFRESGFECEEKRIFDDSTKNKNDTKLSNNISRAKNLIYDYILSNRFKYFCTFTIDSNKFDRSQLDLFFKSFSQWIRDLRKKYHDYDFKYLFIPELHKDKKSWHIHGVFSDLPIDLLERFNLKDKLPKYIRQNIDKLYNMPAYQKKYGFCVIEEIRDYKKCASYITKYISKDLGQGVALHKKLFYHSQNLSLPITEKYKGLYIPEDRYDYNNDYIHIKNFNSFEELQTFMISLGYKELNSLDGLRSWVFTLSDSQSMKE